MAIREIHVKTNLNGFGQVQTISGVLFGGENLAHKFIIAHEFGQAFTGTVSAKFLRYADNVTVPLTGSIENGNITVTLISNCYYYPGRFKLTVYVTADGSTTEIYSCTGGVDRTDGETTVDPSGEITMDVTQLILDIAAAKASIPADYSALLASVAQTFADWATYSAGDYVWYEGQLRRFGSDHVAEPWIGTDTRLVVLADDLSALDRDFKTFRQWTIPLYLSTGIYNVGDYVWYNNKAYRCISAIVMPEEFTPAHWESLEYIYFSTDINRRLVLVQENVAQIFNTYTAYSAGEYVWYNNQLYIFGDDHAAGAWVGEDARLVRTMTQISENTADITDLKSALDNISELQNLFVSNDATDDKRLTSDGGAMSATGYFVSDYIPVEPGCYYEKNSPTINIYHRACFYNSSKTFIANSSVDDSNIMQAPQYGHYVRFCGLMTEKSTADIHLVSAKDEVARLIAKEAFLGLKYSVITDATTYTDADYVPVNSVIAFANETAGSIAHLPKQIGTLITMSYGTINNANYEVQFFFKTDGNMCTRYKIGGSWKAWTEYRNLNDSIIYDRAIGQVLNNILFTVEWTVNKYIDSDTGEVKSTSGSTSVSDKIMIPDMASLSVACSQCQIATYSADGAFIARTGYNHGAVISSASAKYIRIQYASADTSVINANVGLRMVYSDDLVHESKLRFVAENMVQTTVNGTGNPLVLNGTSEKKFESFSITGNAARNVTICGKNIFTLNEQSTITSNGVTFEFDNAAGQISVTSETGATGTAKSAATFENGNFNFTFPVDTYVSVSDNCSQHLLFDSLIQVRVWDYANEKFYSVASGGVSFLASANTKYSVYILVREGWSGSVTFRPQVEIGTHVTARELYNGVTVNVPAGSGSEILSANAFKYADSGNHVKASYQDVDNTLFVEADGEQTSVVLVADRNNVVTIGGVDYYCIDSFTGISGAVCLSGIPKKYGGAIRAQITDGLVSHYDYGSGVIFNADSSKTYAVRVMVNAYTKIRDAIKLSVSTGVLALSHYHSCKGTTTIYTNNSDSITATAVTTTMQENAVSSIATLKSIGLLTGGREKNLLNKLKRYPPLVSFIDDDTTSIAYVKRYHDVFANNNAVGSYAVKTDTVDANTGLLDLLLDYEEEGFGMLYHCYQQNGDQTRYWIKGDPTYDEDKIRENFFTGLRRIAQYGFASYKYWVTPYGVNDGFIVDLAKNTGMQCLFNCPSSTFDQYGYVSPSANCSRWDIPRFGLTQNTDMSKLQKVTDACAADKGWLIVVTHANSWGQYDMETRLGNFIQYCKSSGFKIVPPAVGFETFRSVFDVYDLT